MSTSHTEPIAGEANSSTKTYAPNMTSAPLKRYQATREQALAFAKADLRGLLNEMTSKEKVCLLAVRIRWYV
jgi:hypothetical protein